MRKAQFDIGNSSSRSRLTRKMYRRSPDIGKCSNCSRGETGEDACLFEGESLLCSMHLVTILKRTSTGYRYLHFVNNIIQINLHHISDEGSPSLEFRTEFYRGQGLKSLQENLVSIPKVFPFFAIHVNITRTAYHHPAPLASTQIRKSSHVRALDAYTTNRRPPS